MDADGWQTVPPRRRTRECPDSSRPRQPVETSPLLLNGGKPSYAQAVKSTAPRVSSSTTLPSPSAPRRHPDPPLLRRNPPVIPHPSRQREPMFITSPDSPTTLRFPPSLEDPDWHNRCFKCFTKGHTSRTCTRPRRCAFCWGFNHDYKDCQKPIGKPRVYRPATARARPPARQPPKQPAHRRQEEHNPGISHWVPKQLPQISSPSLQEADFQDLLLDSTKTSTILPADSERPSSLPCFISRDPSYFSRLSLLSKALVISQPPDTEDEFSLDEVARMVASTGLVSARQIRVGFLTKGRYLVTPPDEISAHDICLAFSDSWWDKGFTAGLWSPHTDAEINIPRFKAWIRLVGIPPDLWDEDCIVQAVGRFGTFLGTIASNSPGNLASWDVAVAVHDLRAIPHRVDMTTGAFDRKVPLYIIRWVQSQVYSVDDIPVPPPVVVRPADRHFSPDPDSTSSEAEVSYTFKLNELRRIFGAVDPAKLPSDLAAVLAPARKNLDKGKRPVDGPVILKRNFSVNKDAIGSACPTNGSDQDPLMPPGFTPPRVSALRQGRDLLLNGSGSGSAKRPLTSDTSDSLAIVGQVHRSNGTTGGASSAATGCQRGVFAPQLSRIDELELEASIFGSAQLRSNKRPLPVEDTASQVLIPSSCVPPALPSSLLAVHTLFPESVSPQPDKASPQTDKAIVACSLPPHVQLSDKNKGRKQGLSRVCKVTPQVTPVISSLDPMGLVDVPITYSEALDLTSLMGLDSRSLVVFNPDCAFSGRAATSHNSAPPPKFPSDRIILKPPTNAQLHQVGSPLRTGAKKAKQAHKSRVEQVVSNLNSFNQGYALQLDASSSDGLSSE